MKEFGTIELTEYYGKKLKQACDDVSSLLQYKNSNYGCSAFEDAEVFGTIYTSQDGVMIRLSDKFKRLANEMRLKGRMEENDIIDAIGYMFILLVQHRIENERPSGQVINQ